MAEQFDCRVEVDDKLTKSGHVRFSLIWLIPGAEEAVWPGWRYDGRQILPPLNHYNGVTHISGFLNPLFLSRLLRLLEVKTQVCHRPGATSRYPLPEFQEVVNG
jgi:hypothetical protein